MREVAFTAFWGSDYDKSVYIYDYIHIYICACACVLTHVLRKMNFRQRPLSGMQLKFQELESQRCKAERGVQVRYDPGFGDWSLELRF